MTEREAFRRGISNYAVMLACFYAVSLAVELFFWREFRVQTFIVPLSDALFFSMPAFAVFYVSIRWKNSASLYVILSVLLAAAMSALTVRNAREISLTKGSVCGYLYLHGAITELGYVYQACNPMVLVSFYAIYLFLKRNARETS